MARLTNLNTAVSYAVVERKPLLDGTNGSDLPTNYDPRDKNLITAPRAENPPQEGELGWDNVGTTYVWHDFGWRPWTELYPNNPAPKNPTHLLDQVSGRLKSGLPISDACVYMEESIVSIRRDVGNLSGLGQYNQDAITRLEQRLDRIEKLLALVAPPSTQEVNPPPQPSINDAIRRNMDKRMELVEEARRAKAAMGDKEFEATMKALTEKERELFGREFLNEVPKQKPEDTEDEFKPMTGSAVKAKYGRPTKKW